MRTKEQTRAYMRQYRLRLKKEPKKPDKPRKALRTRVEKPLRACNTLIRVDDWLAERCNIGVFNVTMRNPKNSKELKVYGTQRLLKVLDRCGFKIVN